MKTNKQLQTLIKSLFLIVLGFMPIASHTFAAEGYVKVQPSEADANLSTRYTVTVNGIPVPVIKVKGNVAPSYVQFSFAGEVDVVVRVNETVSSYSLTPKSYNIASSKSGQNISFTLDKPRHLILHHVNSSTESLGIFAESLEENIPVIGGNVLNVMNYGVDNTGGTDNSTQIQNALNALASGGTLYFPAGKYTSNMLQPKANTTLYLAAGAVLQAISNSSSVSSMFYIGNSGVTIRGRGVIDGRGDIHRPAGKMYNLIEEHGGNFSMEGIILRTAPAWHIMTYGSNMLIKNVKWINNYDHANGDGIGIAGTNITVDDCIMMVTDDPLALHNLVASNMNTVVKNTVLFNQIAGGRFFCLGYYTAAGTTSHWDAENLDMANGYRVITNTTGNAFEFWSAGGVISDCSFQNMRLENPCNSLVAGVTYWDFTQWIPGDVGNGSISNISFKEIQQEYFGTLGSVDPSLCPWTNGKNSFNSGWYSTVTATNTINNISFDNYYVNGSRITNITEGQFVIGNYVTNLTFPSSASTKVNIIASDLLADDNGGNNGQFTISRTGSTASDLEVFYTIHGTAINGTNYNTINNSVIIPAGSNSATVTITPILGSAASAYQTVFLSLNKNSNYMVDANYHAVVTITDGSIDSEAPTTPINVNASAITQSGFLLKWNTSTDNVGIATYEILKNGVYFNTSSDTSFLFTGLLPQSEYKITVKAWDGAGNSSESAVLSVFTTAADIKAPSVPTKLSSSLIMRSSFTLAWVPSTDSVAVTSYEVFQNNVSIGKFNDTLCSVSGLTCGTTYSYTVRAFDDAGNVSAKSAGINVTTGTCGGSNIALKKNTTTSSIESASFNGAKAVDGSGTTRWASVSGVAPQWIYVDLGVIYNVSQVKLLWEAASAKDYKIQVSANAIDWVDIYSTTTGDGSTDDIDGLSAKGRYVRVHATARNSSYGYSLYEFEVYGTYLSGDTVPPSIPSNLKTTSITNTSITVSWTASTDNVCIGSYETYKDGAYVASTTATSYTFTDLLPLTEYIISVRAIDCGVNPSPMSNDLKVSTLTTNISENNTIKFSVFPNPVIDNKLIVRFEGNVQKNSSLFKLINTNGSVVYETTINTNEETAITLPENLAKGLYAISITNDNFCVNQKVVIE